MMAKAAASPILQLIRRVVEDRQVSELPDRDLLQQFHARQDQTAFHTLLRRHGLVVLDVCRGVLGDGPDAEDAFQATFLVLAQKADSIRKGAALGSWLHGVAYRTALKARAQSAVRQKHEARAPQRQASEADDLSWREVRQVLHEELGGMPGRYREPLVMCYLEGATQQRAAARLGLAERTVRQRLERGRELLRLRLVQRGLGPAAILAVAAWPAATLSASVPAVLVNSTVKAATSVAAGGTAASVVSAKVAVLTQGVLRTMFLTKLKVSTAGLLVAGLLLGGLLIPGLWALTQLSLAQQPAVKQQEKPPDKEVAKTEQRANVQEEVRAKTWKARAALHEHADQVTSVAYSADVVAVGCKDGSITLWDAGTGKEKCTTSRRHESEVILMHFSPDGRFLASCSRSNKVSFEAVKGGNTRGLKPTKQEGNPGLSFLIMDTAKDLSKDEGTIWAAAIGENMVMTFGPDGEVRAYATGNVLHIFKNDWAGVLKQKPPGRSEEIAKLEGHKDRIRAAAFSLDGKTVVTGSDDKTMRAWQADTGKELAVFEGHPEPVVLVAISPDGKFIASASKDGTAKLWDVATKKELPALKAQKGVRCAAFSADGKFLATGGDDGIVKVWNVAAGQEHATLKGHKEPIGSLTFSPDSNTLASGSQDKTVKLWQVE